jgi:hypothetical protein
MVGRGEKGAALVVIVLATAAAGLMVAMVGWMLWASRRATERLGGSLRDIRCQAELGGRVSPVLAAAGWPKLEDPALPWTAPPGRGGSVSVDGTRLWAVPAGDDVFVYLTVGLDDLCVGDRVYP